MGKHTPGVLSVFAGFSFGVLCLLYYAQYYALPFVGELKSFAGWVLMASSSMSIWIGVFYAVLWVGGGVFFLQFSDKPKLLVLLGALEGVWMASVAVPGVFNQLHHMSYSPVMSQLPIVAFGCGCAYGFFLTLRFGELREIGESPWVGWFYGLVLALGGFGRFVCIAPIVVGSFFGAVFALAVYAIFFAFSVIAGGVWLQAKVSSARRVGGAGSLYSGAVRLDSFTGGR